jgi:hypothetical protein
MRAADFLHAFSVTHSCHALSPMPSLVVGTWLLVIGSSHAGR